MKKFIALLLALFTIASASILVKGIDLADIEEHYITLDIKYGFKSIQYYAYVNYGQDVIKYRDRIVVDENGDNRVFNSTIKVLNTFYKNGWEIKTAITKTSGGGNDNSSISSDTYYILERRDDK